MDRATILRRLATAEEHVAQGAEHVAKQRAVVKQIERRGQNSDLARKVLKSLEASLRTHEADRERLLRELEFVFLLGPGTLSQPSKKR
jgi:hypothetical protein